MWSDTNLQKRRAACVAMFILTSMLLPAASFGQTPCRYEYVTWPNVDCGFGPFPGYPVAVNVHGHVCAKWTSCGEPVAMTLLWTGGPTTQVLPIPPGYRAMDPADMNDLGEIVGTLQLPMGTPSPFRPFLRRADGEVINLGLPPGANIAMATSINNMSEITGSCNIPGVGGRVFLWREGKFTILALPGKWGWSSNQIDDFGRLAVFPFWAEGGVWANGRFQKVGLLPTGTWSDPRSMAPNGSVAVTANIFDPDSPSGDRRRACIHKDGQLLNLGVLPGFKDSFATGITNSTTVGYSQGTTPPGGAIVTFVVPNGVMRRLDQLQPNPNLTINDFPIMSRNGLIAATGRIGAAHVGVVLTPVYAPTGDVTSDCRVNVNDLLAVINSWGSCGLGPFCAGDINSDGAVNHLDLLLVLQNWGQQS